MTTLTLTQAELEALVARRIEAQLTPERLEQLAMEVLARELGLLAPEQAMPLLQCGSKKQLRDLCAADKIPVIHRTTKRWFIERAAIREWLQRTRRLLPDPAALDGTRIARLPDPAQRAA